MQMEPTSFLQGSCWSQSLSHTGFPEGKKPRTAFMPCPADWLKCDCLYETIQSKLINPIPEPLWLSRSVHENTCQDLGLALSPSPLQEGTEPPKCYLWAFGVQQWWEWEAAGRQRRKGWRCSPLWMQGAEPRCCSQVRHSTHLIFPRGRGCREILTQTAQGSGGISILGSVQKTRSVALRGTIQLGAW